MPQQDTPISTPGPKEASIDGHDATLQSKEASLDAQDAAAEKSPPKFQKGPRFWAIIVVLSLISLLTSLEATVTSTVMPSLVADLGGGESFIWVSNAYFLTMSGLFPLPVPYTCC